MLKTVTMRLLVLIILFAFALISCEDNKKTSEAKKEKKSTVSTPIQNEEEKQDTVSAAPKYPFITNENVVSFLTEYGKENLETKVKISTTHGDMIFQLYTDTPLHRANFIYLVKQGYFNETFFHRVVPNFIIQGGNSDNPKTSKKRRKLGAYRLPAELDNGRIHQKGTISGAKEYRKNPDKKSAPYEFFIFVGPLESTSHLNGNYTIFGKVIQGLDVAINIANLPHDETDWPLQNVFIEAEVIE